MPNAKEAIFVGIASYCDTQLDLTLTQLFEKASQPSRVHVGLVLQDHRSVRDAPELAKWRRHPRVRMLEYDPEESRGAGWARSNIAKLHRGEAYYLQLDAHHLFVTGWDETCISLLARLAKRSPKPLLTSYVTNYPDNVTDADELLDQLPWRMTTGHWMKPFGGLTPKKIQYFPAPIEAHIMHGVAGEPQPTAFFSAHFVFVRSGWLRDVPYDPLVYFDGEEDSLGLRSWTSGYDLYYPTTHVVFHRYHRKGTKKHWDDHPQMFNDMTASSIRRLHEIIASGGGPDGNASMGVYGLGRVRTIEQFQHFSGVNYERMWLSTRSRFGEILGRLPSKSAPRLWVHKDGHFQMYKYEEWGETWQEWRHRKDEGAGEGQGRMEAVEAKWVVTSKDRTKPRPNLFMMDEKRGMEMNLTPEGCFYRYPRRNDSHANWTMMAFGYWM